MPAHENPIFSDENAARAHFEALRWPNGPQCPFCGTRERVAVLGGKSMGPGWYHCRDCRKKFTALVSTVYERSHISLCMWLYVTHLLCSSKKSMSSHQIMRLTGLTYKSAWFMTHRIREAMAAGALPPMGGEGGIVEIDETFIGKKEGATVKRGFSHKNAVMSLVERRPEGAVVRSFHVGGTAAADLLPIIKAHVSPYSHVMTDEAGQYTHMAKDFIAHGFTTHSKGEYVRDGFIHTNTVEGFNSVFKRGMVGVYQHCSEHHLHRYVAEFDFCYNNRTSWALTTCSGRKRPSKARSASA